MNIDHICIAVRRIDPARDKLCKLFGYSPKTQKVENTRQEVVVQFIGKSGSVDIKLIEPAGPNSPLIEYLRSGPGLHHICFATEDTTESTNRLVKQGCRLLSEPQPGEAFDDNLISFVYAGFGLNVEVIDTEERRLLLE